MHLQLTAVFRKVPEGYIGFVEELPGANTQGSTLEETRTNLREAVELVIEANRTLAQEDAGPDVIREPLNLQAGSAGRRDLLRHLAAHGCRLLRGRQSLDLRQPRQQEGLERSASLRDQQRPGPQDLQGPPNR